MRRFIFLLLLAACLIYMPVHGQSVQVVKGRVIDKVSQYPIIGAFVELLDSNLKISTATDVDGYFKLREVPVGRHTLRVSSIGYNPVIKANMLVTVGKELSLNIEMEEQVYEREAVVIKVKKNQIETNNMNLNVSARSFDVEETQRFAGSFNDPARLAQSFAGVGAGDDSRNDIIVRGNSPLGVQYRMDGIVIPNPNHFGTMGATGGAVSILNNNILQDSDFMTGAFPSEYGNVLAGMFDLQMRSGNHEKYEGLGQIGFNGLEAGLEGPLHLGDRSSFVANYRYSTLEIFQLLGFSFGTTALPEYQDLSFKLSIPTKKAGKFSVFGIGGLSYIEFLGSELEDDDLYGESNEDLEFGSDVGVVGLNHLFFHNDKTFSKTGLAVSGSRQSILVESLIFSDDNSRVIDKFIDYGNEFSQVKYSLNYSLNKKFSSRNNAQLGFIADVYSTLMQDSTYMRDVERFIKLRDFKGNTAMLQFFAHWQHKFSKKATLNSGLHFQQIQLNNSWALEPRLGFTYKYRPKHHFSVGTGLHSMTQPFQTYFDETEIERDIYFKSNEHLDFTRSAHLIGAYDWFITELVHLKAEAYYQYIFNAPVSNTQPTFSLLNAGADFGIPSVDSLVNDGIGRNYGMEFTLERFFQKGFYVLSTASFFVSEYQGQDEVWRGSAFNNNFMINALAGKEYNISQKVALTLDLKGTWAGGKRYTPIDLEQSRIEREAIYNDDQAFALQHPDYFRVDFKVGLRLNGKRTTQEFAIDVRNITNRKNVFAQEYNLNSGEVDITYQMAILPVVFYRVTF